MRMANGVNKYIAGQFMFDHGAWYSILTRDFIVLVLNIEVFQIKFFLKIKSLKKKKKKKKKIRLMVEQQKNLSCKYSTHFWGYRRLQINMLAGAKNMFSCTREIALSNVAPWGAIPSKINVTYPKGIRLWEKLQLTILQHSIMKFDRSNKFTYIIMGK